MKKSFFEQMGGTYTQMGNHRLPSLELPPEKEQSIGVWGQRRLRCLKQHHKVLYYNLLTSGKLHSHLADTEEQAQQLFLRLVNEYAANEGITESSLQNSKAGTGEISRACFAKYHSYSKRYNSGFSYSA